MINGPNILNRTKSVPFSLYHLNTKSSDVLLGVENKMAQTKEKTIGSPGRTRTYNQLVTRIPMFPKGVDYIIIPNQMICRMRGASGRACGPTPFPPSHKAMKDTIGIVSEPFPRQVLGLGC